MHPSTYYVRYTAKSNSSKNWGWRRKKNEERFFQYQKLKDYIIY